jgi:hypothetical protein
MMTHQQQLVLQRAQLLLELFTGVFAISHLGGEGIRNVSVIRAA